MGTLRFYINRIMFCSTACFFKIYFLFLLVGCMNILFFCLFKTKTVDNVIFTFHHINENCFFFFFGLTNSPAKIIL